MTTSAITNTAIASFAAFGYTPRPALDIKMNPTALLRAGGFNMHKAMRDAAKTILKRIEKGDSQYVQIGMNVYKPNFLKGVLTFCHSFD